MIYLFGALVAIAVGSGVMGVAQLLPSRPPAIARRLAEMEALGSGQSRAAERRRRQERRERWEALLQAVGERADAGSAGAMEVRMRLVHAGFRRPAALRIFLGIRLLLPIALASLLGALGSLLGASHPFPLLFAACGAVFGYIAPSFILDSRVAGRRDEIQRALPDALDLLVVCVEAGLGLNQAIVRVADEIHHVSPAMGEELGLVNLEIRAGTPRQEALRNLGERSGVEDLRSLTRMLIQTDRFGTSVAQALRQQSDTLRTRRRQRAEEAAAKTAIKMLFPLIAFVFPSLFIAILGPAAIQVLRTLILDGGAP